MPEGQLSADSLDGRIQVYTPVPGTMGTEPKPAGPGGQGHGQEQDPGGRAAGGDKMPPIGETCWAGEKRAQVASQNRPRDNREKRKRLDLQQTQQEKKAPAQEPTPRPGSEVQAK